MLPAAQYFYRRRRASRRKALSEFAERIELVESFRRLFWFCRCCLPGILASCETVCLHRFSFLLMRVVSCGWSELGKDGFVIRKHFVFGSGNIATFIARWFC